MRFIKLSLCLVVFWSTTRALAVEGGGEAGASTAVGGEGAAAGAEGGAVGSSGGADREWAKRTNKLNKIEAQIADLTRALSGLIHQNEALLDPKKSAHKGSEGEGGEGEGKKVKAATPTEVTRQIDDTYRKLKESVSEYNKEKNELKYRFPEEGLLVERRYLPMRVKSLDEIGRESSLDAELTQTKKRIDQKYAVFTKEDDAPKPKLKQKEKLRKQNPDEDGKRLRFSQ